MPAHRWIKNTQVALMSIGVVAVAGLLCGLLWLNQRGFGGEWSTRISAELSALGIHADFAEARFSPLRGIIVTDAIIYFDASRQSVFARIPKLKLDVDRAKALRGEVVLRRCELRNADLQIPLIGDAENPVSVHLTGLSGHLAIDRQGRLLLENATGTLGGMKIALNAELTRFDPATLSRQAEQAGRGGKDGNTARREFLDKLLAEVERWDFPPDRAPTLNLQVTGDLGNAATIKTSFDMEAAELVRRGKTDYPMTDVTLRGLFFGRRATLDHFEFSDGAGRLTSQVDYDLLGRQGHYRIESSIHLARMLRACFDNNVLDKITTAHAPLVEGSGGFSVAPDGSLRVGATGSIELQSFVFLRTSYESLKTDFSWQDGDLYLRNLHAAHAEGELTGQVLIQGDQINYQAVSSLPIAVFNPFIRPEGALAKIISRASFNPESEVLLRARGTMRRSNLREWASTGEASVRNVSYNGVPLRSAEATYDITPLESSYTAITAVFDYANDSQRKRYGGPASAMVRADRIGYDHAERATTIENLRGTAWPGPVLRLFNATTADHVEKSYRFRTPPTFTSNGLIGHLENSGRTNVLTTFDTHATTNYTFLNQSLDLDDVSAEVRYRHLLVDVNKLKFSTFEGSGGGNITVRIRPGGSSGVSGGIRWTKLRLADIGQTYGFAKAKQGYVTGRLDFDAPTGNVRSLNGTGAIGLEQGHLFFVPVLGPLSTLLGEVAGDKRASHEEARDASCTFALRDGIFYTRDFLTSTPSSVFTGEGSIDLHRQVIDMTVRMNARGLLGLITLPLRPFNGLFQFRGQGPLKNPTWARANFVPPPDGKNDPIFRDPGRAVIVPER